MRARALGALVVAAGVFLAFALLRGRDEPAPPPDAPLPVAPLPTFTVATPRPLAQERPAARWSPVLRSVAVRSEPSADASVTSMLTTRTPDGTRNLVLVRSRATGADGDLWIRIVGPGLPGETEGWVPRGALGPYHAVRTRLVVDVEDYTATLLRGTRVVARFPVGVGVHASPTPRGEFYVRDRLTRYRDAFYGPLAFGTSVRSPFLTDWPDGGFVGIHGTNQPELLPGRVSHGCIRLRNEDIVALDRLMPVGTPITIR
jgi:hypothetical protein